MMTHETRPRLLFKTLALGLDKTSGQGSVGHPDEEFESATCPMRKSRQRVGHAMCPMEEFFVRLPCVRFFFGVYVTRGAKRGETFMASHRPWDGYQTACRFDSSGLGVWSFGVPRSPIP